VSSARTKILLVLGTFAAALCLSFLLIRIGTPTAGQMRPAADGSPTEFSYKRIVCMSPAISEIVFALGAGGRVVGVSQHTKYPPEALAKPTCGGFFNPSRERILSVAPDLLIVQGKAAKLTSFADSNGIQILALSFSNLESIFTETKRLGKVLQLDAEAELLCAGMRYRLAGVRVRAAHKMPLDMVMVVGREPGTLSNIHVVGPGSFLDDLIRIAGGRNVFSDLPGTYGMASKEALMDRAPEVVVELHGEGADEKRQEDRVRELWEGLAPLPAVANRRVYVVESTYAMIPGPRVVELAERLAGLLHEGDQ